MDRYAFCSRHILRASDILKLPKQLIPLSCREKKERDLTHHMTKAAILTENATTNWQHKNANKNLDYTGNCKLRNGNKRKETKRNGKKKKLKENKEKSNEKKRKKRNAKIRKQNSEKRNETKEKEKKRKKNVKKRNEMKSTEARR